MRFFIFILTILACYATQFKMPPGTSSRSDETTQKVTQPYGPYPSDTPIPFCENGKPSSVDARDIGTPDEWVKRDGR